jgi:hypothetical protein
MVSLKISSDSKKIFSGRGTACRTHMHQVDVSLLVIALTPSPSPLGKGAKNDGRFEVPLPKGEGFRVRA